MTAVRPDRCVATRLLLSVFILCLLLPPALAADTKTVLVLYSNNRLVPGNVAVDQGLRSSLASSPDRPVHLFSEFLDEPEFRGQDYEGTIVRYLREKYAPQPPDVIIGVSNEAFEFLLHHRSQLFPGVPLVHAAVSTSFLKSMSPLPGDVVGVPREYDPAGTIEQALRWHPDAQRLVVVIGNSERDREWDARLHREIPPVTGSLPVEFLIGLPTAAVLKRVSELGATAIVFTPGYFRDGAGALFNPRDVASLIASRIDCAGLRTLRHFHRYRRSRRPNAKFRRHGQAGSANRQQSLRRRCRRITAIADRHPVGAARRLAAGAALGHRRA